MNWGSTKIHCSKKLREQHEGYLQPSHVAQVVELLQDRTTMHTFARRFAVSPSTVLRAWRRYQETGC